MSVDIHSEESQIIRQLIPVSTIPINQFESLCDEITVETAEQNTFLFTKNDTANDLIYLIEGSITLQSDKLKVETIKSGTPSSRFALAHQIPRKIDAYTNTTVRFLRLDLDTITALASISYEEESNYMVADETEQNDDDWLSTLLQSPIFSALPPSNLQQIIMGLEEVFFEKGTPIITQGEPGDCYYIIKKGKCLLTRQATENAKGTKLAELTTLDTFGEDALLSDEPRNVSITALTKMSLLRLNKDKFIALIIEPTLKLIKHEKIMDKLAEGAILLDVRTPDEYKKHHLPKSVNIPFLSLRLQLKLLDKSKPVVVVCKNGKNSAAAAFILLKQQFNTFIVEGGMSQTIDDSGRNEIPNEDAVENNNEPETVTENPEKIQTLDVSQTEQLNDQDTEYTPQKQENEQLKLTIQKLTAEKQELEKNYRLLYQQTTKLKAALDSLKKAGNESD